ncbi:hypothetical protein N9L68_04385 [bacterium]|nr:hypothetical protein [bacterium]
MGQRMIRATGKHTFEASASERRQERVSRALVQYCRRVQEIELVDVAKGVDASVDQPASLSLLQSVKHNGDDRLRFKEWIDGSERWFTATRAFKPPRFQTKPSCDHPRRWFSSWGGSLC